ncbi:MAG: DNA-deoxyinosine glycosylase [Lachnospiraceae bacterium]|nr:DNA-deoxyinosine glycosylase [Lachnospiraceae bacterium]
MLTHIIHPIPPVYDEKSRILILGSFPSVKSRESGFFYGHPQNRYWKVLAAIFGDNIPLTVPDKKAFLLRHHIAAWDVIASCDIEGSSDSSIKNAVPNDLSPILETANIEQIFTNGKTAYTLFQKYTAPLIHRDSICLPSTSPANAAWTLEKLTEAWKVIFRI